MGLRMVAMGSGLGLILSCGGTKEPVLAASAPSGAELFVLDPSAGCMWRVVGVDGGTRDLARTAVCPDKLWFAPDGKRVVASGGGWAWYGPLDALVAVEAPYAETVFPVDGEPLIAHVVYEESRTFLVSQRLEGAGFGAPMREELSISDLMMGNPLGRHADADANWTSLHLRDTPSKSAYIESPSAAAALAVSATEGSGVGGIQVGGQLLVYRIGFGDTPHPEPPLVWCAALDCSDATALTGALPRQLTLEPQGELVLVTEEYSSGWPVVYRTGRADPEWTGPTGALAMWAPAGL